MTARLTHAGPRLRIRRVPIAEALVVTAERVCPECAGQWMRELLMQHTNACSIRAAEDARLAADMDVTQRSFTRPATQTERTLGVALGVPGAATAATVQVVKLTRGVRRRMTLGDVDLDRLATPEEIAAAIDDESSE